MYFLPLICSVPLLLFHRVAHVIYEETILPQYIITKRSELLFFYHDEQQMMMLRHYS